MSTPPAPANRTQTVETHYQRLADHYDEFLHYSPAFIRALTSKMIAKLQLTARDRFVDLGCGTAMYTLDILAQVPLAHPVVGVDPIPQMLARIPPHAPVRAVVLDALTFSAQDGVYDKILMKEAAHHVDDRRTLFANLFQRLAPEGRLLLVHVPPTLAYPLFQAALRRAEQWHADPDELVRLLGEMGFRVERDGLDYRHAMPKRTYFKMVDHCYMSVLSSFSREEIATGLAEMEQTYREVARLSFVDHFDYITAIKTA